MERRRWKKIETLLDRALRLREEDDRKAFIRQAADDKQLIREAIEMLGYIQQAEQDDFLNSREY